LKVAKKSLPNRRTLTLPRRAFSILERLRGSTSRSAFVEQLLSNELSRIEQKKFYDAANSAYTPTICAETIRVNDEFPVDEK
jgi:hypothetical protein